jgi:HlyD family secretion protein
MRKKIIIGIVFLAIISLIFLFFTRRGQQTYATQKVSRQDIEEKVFATGELSSEKRADLTFRASGKISNIYFDPGDQVKKGEIIASLDKTDLQSTLNQAQNSYNLAQSNVEKVLDDIRLYQYGAGGTTGETQTQKNLREVAQSTRDSAYDALQISKNSLRQANLTSPIDGTVTSISKKEGENVVGYSTAIATVADLRKPTFDTELDENDIGKTKIGQKAKVTVDAYPEKEFEGDIWQIEPQITKTAVGTNVIKVKIKLNSFDSPLIIGLGGDSEIKTNEVKNTLTVPQSAVFEQDTKKFVYVVESGKAKKMEVETGLESQDQIEIKSGIAEGQIIITEKTDKVKEGQKIKIPANGK